MKPLLILTPAPARWNAIHDLLDQEDQKWVEDLRTRFTAGVPGARDAAAVSLEGSQAAAGAFIRRVGEIGVLAQVYTRPAHRRSGRARLLLQTLLSWFDMTGGKWLYLACPPEVGQGLFSNFGFRVLQSGIDNGRPVACMLRTPAHTPDTPFDNVNGEVQFRPATRADLVSLTALLMHHCGPDPRTSVAETALAADATALDLIDQAQSGRCHLTVALRRARITGAGTLALDQSGRKTYALVLPHDHPPPGLRENLLESARVRGFEQVEFPMDALAAEPAASTRERPVSELGGAAGGPSRTEPTDTATPA